MVEEKEAREIFLRDAARDFEGKWQSHLKEEQRDSRQQVQQGKIVSGQGRDIIKELPLSKFEVPLNAIITMIAVIAIMLGRLEIVPGLEGIGLMVAVGFIWGFYMVKRMFFMPVGKKVIVLRAYKNSGIRLSVEKIKHDRLIHFDKKDDVPPSSVERMNKHFEISTGRPFVIAMEEKTKNISLFDSYQEDKEAKEFNNIIKTTWGTAWQACLNNMLKFQNRITDPMFLITLLVLIVLVVSVVLQVGATGQILEALGPISDAVGVSGA